MSSIHIAFILFRIADLLYLHSLPLCWIFQWGRWAHRCRHKTILRGWWCLESWLIQIPCWDLRSELRWVSRSSRWVYSPWCLTFPLSWRNLETFFMSSGLIASWLIRSFARTFCFSFRMTSFLPSFEKLDESGGSVSSKSPLGAFTNSSNFSSL